MNTPNKLTLLRIVLVPFFIFFLLMTLVPGNHVIALVIFILASLTDLFDGKLARKHGQVTNFGKFLDPLADKVLVISALVCFLDRGWCSSVAVIIIIAREFLVTSLRLVAVDNGTVIAASKWGKLKTAFTMAALIAVMLLASVQDFGLLAGWDIALIGNILVWVATALTLFSGADYLWKNRSAVNTTK